MAVDKICKATVVGRKASASQPTLLVTITREEGEVNPISLEPTRLSSSTRAWPPDRGGIEENLTRPGGVRTFLSLPVWLCRWTVRQ